MIPVATEAGRRIRGIARLILGKSETSDLKTHFARSSTGTLGLKVIAAGVAFLTSVLLARLLGAGGYGSYAYAIAWVRLLVIPAVLGLDKLLIREMAACHARSNWDLMKGLLRRSHQAVLIASLSLALLGAAIGFIQEAHLGSQMLITLWIALIIVPLLAFTRLKQGALQGLHKVVRGQTPETLIQPLLFGILVGSAYLILGRELNPPFAAGTHVLAAGVALVVGTTLLRKALPRAVKEAAPVYQTRTWMRSALPLLFASGMYIIHARIGTIMLGSLVGAEAAGIYTVADQGAALITYVLFAVNAVLAPTISNLFTLGEMERLQRVVTKSARVILLASLPIAFGLIVFGYWFLLLFGQDFTRGQAALILLSVAQIATAAVGPVIQLLIMTGHEREAAKGVAISALVNVILNTLLIPIWGLEGAAIAMLCSTFTLNLLLIIWVYKRVGIHPTALGKITWRRKPMGHS